MDNGELQDLVNNGDILSYEYLGLDADGKIGSSNYGRDTERVTLKLVTLKFPSGRQLTIDSGCSGCREYSYLSFSVKDHH